MSEEIKFRMDRDLETVMSGNMARLSHEYASTFVAKYAHIKNEMQAAGRAANAAAPKLHKLYGKARDTFTPHWKKFRPEAVDLEDFALFKFINVVMGKVFAQILNSAQHLSSISHAYRTIEPMFGREVDFGTLSMADRAAAEMIDAVEAEFRTTVEQSQALLAGVYLATRREYKKMRRKYLGETAGPEDRDELEDQMMMRLFGLRPDRPEAPPTGPARALVDNNCVLTQLLEDLAGALPKRYERVVPVMRGKKATAKTRVVREVDPGEVDDFIELIRALSDEAAMRFARDPGELLGETMKLLVEFHDAYAPVAAEMEALMKANSAAVYRPGEGALMNPRAIERRYRGINFLAIQPLPEDTLPRTRVERDYAGAREALYGHLLETLANAGRMDDSVETAEYLGARVREAIALRDAMEDVTRTEAQRRLHRDVKDDNEFYVCGTDDGPMQHGMIKVVREAAPKIRYEDVVGASFVEAKEHVEEVVEIASHPHIMRLSAPRGDVRSNLLLIGPYGCGKTEFAKAVGADPRIVGVVAPVSSLLTAYMHESVKNVARLYEQASDLRKGARYTKPVSIIMDEFDRLFSFGEGVNTAYDGDRMVGALQEQMDGVVGREGVFLVAMTNFPKAVPEAVLRRFKYVDVVGQLTKLERMELFKMFLLRGLPVDPAVDDHAWLAWADRMEDAPGDVVGKVADEVHFVFMKQHIKQYGKSIGAIERALNKRLRDREPTDADRRYLKDALAKHGTVRAEDVERALEEVLRQPQVRMQIRKAHEVYRDAQEVLKGLEGGAGFTARGTSRTWDRR